MREVVLKFDGKFKTDKITTKKICNRNTLIIVDNDIIKIIFEKDIELTYSYLSQIAAFCRNYCLITSQIYKIDGCNLSKECLKQIKSLSLLSKTTDN